VRPLGSDRRPPRELETPEVPVPEDSHEAGEGVNRSAHSAIESHKPTPDKAVELERRSATPTLT
jgi:hypothetical protein